MCEKHYKMNVEKAEKGRESKDAQEYIRNMKKIRYGMVMSDREKKEEDKDGTI